MFKYALIICLGSVSVWWLIVPGLSLLFGDQVLNMWDPSITQTISEMSPEQIFTSYGKSIGIGGIAMAGIIGIIKSWGIIKSAVGLAAQEMKGGNGDAMALKRTEKDLSFKFIAIASILTIVVTFLFFWFGVMDGNMFFALVAIVLVTVIAFLFTTVAANAIAIVGSNPVSGMTLMTLILASVVMVGPVNSHIVIPVTMLNSSTIASGRRKLATMAATKMMPVMVLIIKFFIIVECGMWNVERG